MGQRLQPGPGSTMAIISGLGQVGVSCTRPPGAVFGRVVERLRLGDSGDSHASSMPCSL
jgi:hypothetical protein